MSEVNEIVQSLDIGLVNEKISEFLNSNLSDDTISFFKDLELSEVLEIKNEYFNFLEKLQTNQETLIFSIGIFIGVFLGFKFIDNIFKGLG